MTLQDCTKEEICWAVQTLRGTWRGRTDSDLLFAILDRRTVALLAKMDAIIAQEAEIYKEYHPLAERYRGCSLAEIPLSDVQRLAEYDGKLARMTKEFLTISHKIDRLQEEIGRIEPE